MIGISITGLDATVEKLSGLGVALSELNGLHDHLGALGEQQTRQRFYEQRDPSGRTWDGLEPTTIKRKKGRTDRLLDRGRLVASLTYERVSGGVFVFADLPAERVAPHQFGSPSQNIPQRAIFGLSEEDRQDMEQATVEWLEGVF